jgi:uncharacterized protein
VTFPIASFPVAARIARSALVGLCLLVLLGTVHAQDGRRGFLYEIRKGQQASLLFGTIHVGRPDFYPLSAGRQAHLLRFDALVLEADLTDEARAVAATRKYALYGDGVAGLDTRLEPELRGRVERLIARNRFDAATMFRMKPWMLGTVLALFEAGQAGYLSAASAEAYLTGLAKAQGKPILEFEGIERQFELFENAPWSTQVAFLEDALRAVETPAARRDIHRIVRAWEFSDRDALERLLAEMRAQTSVGARFTVDTVLLGRHDGMVRRIQALMADGRSYLFAVGSLHLVGPHGLVELLKARGYEVTEL